MTARVVGLDVSTACTGVALPDGRLMSVRPATHLAKGDAPYLRAQRNSEIADSLAIMLRRQAGAVDVAVVEGYLLEGPGGPWVTIRLAEVGSHARLVLYRLRIPFVEVAPSTVKRWATGKGGCDKAAMIAAAEAAGAKPTNSDEADAWHLRSMGVANYGDWQELDDERRLVLSRYPWPDLAKAAS